MFNNKSHRKNERVIVDGRIVDVAVLRDEAKKAGTRFWVLLVLVSLISSMLVPYLSMASIVSENSHIFDSEAVIPGYSMGGIEIASYGVDINSWGQSPAQSESNPHIVQSTYGYWTKTRAENASKNLVASRKADKNESGDLSGFSVDDSMMTSEQKAKGWIGITRDGGEGLGLSDFHLTKSGREDNKRDSYSEAVAPYRTQEDWRFWDTRAVGGTDTSMTTTLYPDFVIFGWNSQTKTARVLGNPDSIENPTSAKSGSDSIATAVAGTMAVPHYVPISTLFEEFGLDKTVMGKDGMNDMDALLDAIKTDAQKHKGKSPILNKIIENKSHNPKYDLLIGTHYDNLNGSNQSQEKGSDAWNPYPYSMVFSMPLSDGLVTSSIYNNTEAYVYFSPYSVYNNYMSLRNEYDELVKAYATSVADENPATAFQLGYYLAGMSILEAYLNEALPQDMTRGYVGPAEGNPRSSKKSVLANDKKLDTRSGNSNTVSNLFKSSLSSIDGSSATAVGFKSVAYSQLMYDFADAAIVKFKKQGSTSKLGSTSAIMNTLSTYGYGMKDTGTNVNTSTKSAGQGPNRGMTRRQAMAKVTAFGPYSSDAKSLDTSKVTDKNDPMLHPDATGTANTGFYVPGYYPIQAHEMALSEMTYRFQVVADIPYETAVAELARHGFNSAVSLSYQNNAIENLSTTKQYYNKAASLSQQLNEIDEQGGGLSLSGYDSNDSILLSPDATTSMVGEQMTKAFSNEKDLTTRVDNAFLSFKQGRMNSDNVHDLVDIVRAIPGVKYETFMRYYNPLKSSGGTDDLFLTRVTPAQTAYMPKMLTNGYESAGGTTNNASIVQTSSANFDYFSIPSFGPCFAAKTAENTYYGTINYELRAFYTKGFLNNLPSNANVPALEKYEAASKKEEDGEEEEEEEDQTSIDGIKDKVTTIYIMAKRLSFATAYGKLMDAQDGGEGSVSLGSLDASGLQGSVIASKNLSAIKAALKPSDASKYKGATNDNGKQGLLAKKTNRKVQTSNKKKGDTGEIGQGAQAVVNAAKKAVNSTSTYLLGGNPFANGTKISEIGESNGVLNLPQTDCSGLVSFCYAQTGLTSTRYCSADFPGDSNFTQVSYAEAKPGDVAWWPGHVGVYIGNGATIEHAGPTGTPIREFPDRASTWPPERYYHFKAFDGGSSRVAASLSSLTTKVASDLVAMALQVDSGDFVMETASVDAGQKTVWYDDGEGKSNAVAYVNTESGWVAQAESLGTSTPMSRLSGNNQTNSSNEPSNGIPSSWKSVTSTPSIPSVPSTPSATPSTPTSTPSSPASEAKSSPTQETPSSDSSPNATDNGTADGQEGAARPETPGADATPAIPDDTSPYADNGGEADQIYIKDHLTAKGYIKASGSQWKDAKGTHRIDDVISFHIPSGTTFESNGDFDYVMQKFGQKHIISDELLGKKTVWCKDANGYAFVTNIKTVFTGLYNDAFNALLIPSGTYYWDSAKNIATYSGKFDKGDSKKDEMVEYNTVAMEYAKAGNAGIAKEVLDEYCQEAFGDAAEVWKNMAALNDELPQQMQNVLAWADTQTVAESEQNYLGDANEPNLIITIGTKKIQPPSIGIIRSLADLESAQFEIADNDGDWAAIPIVDNGPEDDDLQSRMVRGVAGTIATASGNLAAYTISATVGRIDRTVTSNTSKASIPYSGICTGALTAGTDRYALLQSHSIDREGISSGLSGDLKSKTTGGTSVATASSTTDAGTQKSMGKVANLVGEYASSSIPAATDGVISAFSSVLPDVGTGKTLESDKSIAGALFSTLSSPSSQTMAMTSTFDSATMNRRSAAAQSAGSGTGILATSSGASAYASAANGGLTKDRSMARLFVDGIFSDAYSVIQSIALLMVLAFLMVIAFQNFVGYTSGKESEYIIAQTKLKTVLPRTLIAVAMIGLPPMGGQQGFPGGCYLLLQIVNAIMDATLGVLTQGSSTTELLSQIQSCLTETGRITWPWEINLFSIILNLLACTLFSIGAAAVIMLVLITNILLLAFWALGPIMWAFYTWPYNGNDRPNGKGMLGQMMSKMTGKMGIRTISGKSVGNDAPSGWLIGYITTLSTIAGWNVMFWIAGAVFNRLRGGQTGTLSTSGSANGKLSPAQIVSGQDVFAGSSSVFDNPAGGLILVILFLGLVYLMFLMLKNNAGGVVGAMYKGVGGTVGTIRNHMAYEIGEMALTNEDTQMERLKKNPFMKNMSEDQLRRIAKATSASNPTAVKIGNTVRVADNAAHDIGNRMNRIAEHYAKPLSKRSESSGAFDGLLNAVGQTVQRTNGKGDIEEVQTGLTELTVSPSVHAAGHALTSVLPATKKMLERRRNKIDARLKKLEMDDYKHRDLRQLDTLEKLSPNCMSNNELDSDSIEKAICDSYSKLEAARRSGDMRRIQESTAELHRQLEALEPQEGSTDKLQINDLQSLSQDEMRQRVRDAVTATNSKFFRNVPQSTGNYATNLRAQEKAIKVRHEKHDAETSSLKAIRDSIIIRLGEMTDTSPQLVEDKKNGRHWELPQGGSKPKSSGNGNGNTGSTT